MVESNFYLLSYCKLPRKEQDKRLAQLESTLAELEKYHLKARPAKKPLVARMIVAYDNLIESIQNRLEK